MSEVIELKFPASARPFDLDELRMKAPPPAGTPSAREARLRVAEPFFMAPLDALVRGGRAFSNRSLLVWVYILRQAKLRDTSTVLVPNRPLIGWGVSPDAKVRALRRLEGAVT